ncbi:DUF3618 domain-containing protein [Consotaella salsifontis]|uniref:DUF3618 domain-containing protein n=1 Tax=Consotaella salsifontis TaxID=1365950 RepID=A0A1T4R8J1_9HYPH|nr:DUF3618 domain-containing protein [Consotaella salsifontis]SKA12136.1 Protein of unknown function [Consotaella salsifontis]
MDSAPKSTSDIEREAEKQRAKVASKLDELRLRFSADAVLDRGLSELKGPLGDRLIRAAIDNPLATVMMVAGAGWLFYDATRPRSVEGAHEGASYPPPARMEDLHYGGDQLVPYDDAPKEPNRPMASSPAVAPEPAAASPAGQSPQNRSGL